MIMILKNSPANIKFSYADSPGNIWSTLTTITTDSSDTDFDAAMDENGHIHVVYSDSNNFLIYRKLTFTAGNWTVGNAGTVYSTDPSYYPSIVLEPTGKLWIGWTKLVDGSRYLCVKSSTDSGTTWGSGPSDDGELLTGPLPAVYPKLIIGAGNLHAIYADGTSELAVKSYPIEGGSWSAKVLIASGSELDNNFDAALSTDGMLGVVFDDNELKYREFDGSNWSAITNLDSNEGFMPQLIFINNVPYVIYTSYLSDSEYILKYVSRKSGSFSLPALFDPSAKTFDSVQLYNSVSATYENLTSESENSTTADIYHSSSNGLLKNIGDALYLGMNLKFRYLYFNLFTAGTGGAVIFSYWDGSNWKSFTPEDGNYNLDASEKKLILFDDQQTIPQDWQKSSINNSDNFWIKIETVTAYATAPVGNKISAVSDIHAFSVRR